MPLDVTTGPPAVATGIGPPGSAGPSETGLTTGEPAALFAALLVQQGQTASAILPKTSAAPEMTPETDAAKHDKTDQADPQQPSAQGQIDLTAINWAALAALQTPIPAQAQNAIPTADNTVSSAPTTQSEVMDTASLSAPAVPAATTDAPSSGLLPLSTVSQPQPDALSTASAYGNVVTGVEDLVNASPLGETTSQSSAHIVPSSFEAPLANTLSLPNTPMGSSDDGEDVAPATQAVVPVSALATVTTTSVPSLPTISGTNGTPLEFTMAAAQSTVMSGLGVNSKTPAAGLPTIQSTPFGGAKSSTETAAQIALQNAAVPANNTGKTETPQGTQAATPKSETVVMPVTVKAVKAKQEPTLPQGGVLKSINRHSMDDKSAKADGSTVSQDSASVPGAPMIPTAFTPPEPRVSTTAIAEQSLTDAERTQIVRQAAEGISTVKPQVVGTGQGRMTLNLHPKEWGDLRVTVQLAPAPAIDGVKQTTVVAHVVAGSPVVKTALEKHSADLNQALRETGLHLERLTVTVQAASAGEHAGGAGGEGRSFGQKSQDPWQGAQSQTAHGNGGMGAGGSSSFASYGERQGGNTFQNQSVSRSAYAGGDESDTERLPVSSRSSGLSAGFDQRA